MQLFNWALPKFKSYSPFKDYNLKDEEEKRTVKAVVVEEENVVEVKKALFSYQSFIALTSVI